ncbi:Hsp20/alpha crystallin family protein [Actinomadura sp. NPDC047616]|uniref:Hsp20/alpha crystallin family protein n=1 Tax=Actinomadura sp. NPDC047616 TaxID=3155914 RepID=UPI0033DF57E8
MPAPLLPRPRMLPWPRAVLRRVARYGPLARLLQAGRPIRAEDYVQDGRYIIRADLPGVDPSRDVRVSVHDRTLEIRAVRRADLRNRNHTEIPYGLLRRVVTLPHGADGDTLTTHYADGVLEIALAVPGNRPRR